MLLIHTRNCVNLEVLSSGKSEKWFSLIGFLQWYLVKYFKFLRKEIAFILLWFTLAFYEIKNQEVL